MKSKNDKKSSLKSILGFSMLLFLARSNNYSADLDIRRYSDPRDSKRQIPGEVGKKSIDQLISMETNRFRSACKNCDICTEDCTFLQQYGPPSTLLEKCDFSRRDHQKIVFECSLCGLCAAICPEKLNFADLFLLVRRKAVMEKNIDLNRYNKILNYEKLGASRLFSYYGLPDACDAVYFPGCSFPGTRPEITLEVFQYLRSRIPHLGVVLDCCAKPSHDLGRQAYFGDAFGRILRKLETARIKNIIVNCPSCYETFKTYGKGFVLSTVYEWLHINEFSLKIPCNGEKITIHDPCVLRNEKSAHTTVRDILSKAGFSIQEMRHVKKYALCCGEGGSVGFTDTNFSKNWTELREKERENLPMITYCAGCSEALTRTGPTHHLLDLIFCSCEKLRQDARAASAPLTYLNRLKLKHRFQKKLARKIDAGD